MATIPFQHLRTNQDGVVAHILWETLTATNADGSPFFGAHRPDKTVSVQGTFGGTVTLQGSNEATPVTWFTLNDTTGAALTFTTARLALVAENPLWIRPLAGAGVGDVDVYLIAVAPESRV